MLYPPLVKLVVLTGIAYAGRGEAWFMPPLQRNKGERRPVGICFHGYGEVIDFPPDWHEFYRLVAIFLREAGFLAQQ